ncbi:hypothetical protein HDU76_010746 [Blyttiomyces sp. JEL0837]|nr:hypothetical protein HDU76_010746 [Blyttiomyces sp. JEL0837]
MDGLTGFDSVHIAGGSSSRHKRNGSGSRAPSPELVTSPTMGGTNNQDLNIGSPPNSTRPRGFGVRPKRSRIDSDANSGGVADASQEEDAATMYGTLSSQNGSSPYTTNTRPHRIRGMLHYSISSPSPSPTTCGTYPFVFSPNCNNSGQDRPHPKDPRLARQQQQQEKEGQRQAEVPPPGLSSQIAGPSSLNTLPPPPPPLVNPRPGMAEAAAMLQGNPLLGIMTPEQAAMLTPAVIASLPLHVQMQLQQQLQQQQLLQQMLAMQQPQQQPLQVPQYPTLQMPPQQQIPPLPDLSMAVDIVKPEQFDVPPPPPPVSGAESGAVKRNEHDEFVGAVVPVTLVEPQFEVEAVELPEGTLDDAVKMSRDAVQRILDLEKLFTWPIISGAAAAANNGTNGALIGPGGGVNGGASGSGSGQLAITAGGSSSSSSSSGALAMRGGSEGAGGVVAPVNNWYAELTPLEPTETVSAARTGWILILVRLITREIAEMEEMEEGSLGMDDGDIANKNLRERMVDFVLNEFRARHEIAVLWLYEEYRMDLERKLSQAGEDGNSMDVDESAHRPRYPNLFHRLLVGLRGELRADVSDKRPGLDPRDRTFTKFLIDAPEVTEYAIDVVVRGYCDDPLRYQLGLSTLRDLVNLRPASRQQCLDLLLSYCIHPTKATRSNAIRIVKRWFAESAPVADSVEQFAVKMLEKLLGPPPAVEIVQSNEEDAEAMENFVDAAGLGSNDLAFDDVAAPAGSQPSDMSALTPVGVALGAPPRWLELDVVRHVELFFVLCSCNKKEVLLLRLFTMYPDFTRDVANVILGHIHPLIRSLAQDPDDMATLVKLIRDFPQGAKDMASRVVEILTEKEKPSKELVSAVYEAFKERDLDGMFVLPVITGLDKAAILQSLPKVLSCLDDSEVRRRMVEDTLIKIASDPPVAKPAPAGGVVASVPAASTEGGNAGPIVPPSELLIAIHNLEESVGVVKRWMLEGTQICLRHPEVFKQEVLAIVIQQLSDQGKLPRLLMATVIGSVKQFPNLAGFVSNILTKLVGKKIWTQGTLWEGFIRCCGIIAPTSFAVLVNLPKDPLEDVLKKMPGLKPRLFEYMSRLPKSMGFDVFFGICTSRKL